MNVIEVAIAILREWPGTPERLVRLARNKGYLTEWNPEEPPKSVVDGFFRSWAVVFVSQRLTDLTDDELTIRFALDERLLTECDHTTAYEDDDGASAVLAVDEEMCECRRLLARTQAEVDRRALPGWRERELAARRTKDRFADPIVRVRVDPRVRTRPLRTR